MKAYLLLNCLLLIFSNSNRAQQCRFEKSGGKETATYFEVIDWYQQLDKISSKVLVKQMGMTDAGYPLHLVLVSNDGTANPAVWHRQNKVVILINNGIHPGEPDGIDASMMLVRDIATGKIKLPINVALAFIPVYNIGGSLNRGSFSRVNQDGPLEYGFRGNSQNLDLNRDFTKCDSREAKAFSQLFHLLDPDILMDNHVSDGADYQHTMTLLTSQYNKLGGDLGNWLKQVFEPQLYKSMASQGWDMAPYVDFATSNPDDGLKMFYDPPRYSSGYATLFQTIAFVPETHMLKPFKERVTATYVLMQTMIEKAGSNATALVAERRKAKSAVLTQQQFSLAWRLDTTRYSTVKFMGYNMKFKTSEATGLQRMYYDRNEPYTKQVRLYDVFTSFNTITKPTAYIVPKGWHAVIDLLKINNVQLRQLPADTTITVEAYHIDECKPAARAYEKHHKNSGVKVTVTTQAIKFLNGDFYIPLNQPANRYLVEMLEPTGDDSFFSWNFFDAILQQKEGYSDYRWEDVAITVLKKSPSLQKSLMEKKQADTAFAKNAQAQLEYIYKNSPYYEPVHLRYPVYRLVQ